MDWNSKKPSWDLAEFDQEASPNISSISGSSSFGGQGSKGDFSVDLKLGHMVNLGNESAENSQVQSVPKMGLLPPGSSKRARAVNNGIHAASCMVDGCNADLSHCKEYYRRHKVCEMHSKSPEVTIGGHKQRFCQQCSRFHSLEEFDEGKRSCRKRLDGHNRRRRKPQPEPLSRTGSFLSSYQGSRLFPFSGPEVYPTTALPNPIWAGVVKTKQEAPELYNQHLHVRLHDRHNLYPGSSSSSYRDEGRQFSFLQGDALTLSSSSQTTVPDTSACLPFLKTLSESGGHSHEMFSDGFSTQALNSNCALSLLSPSPMQTSDMGFSRMVAPDSIPLSHPLGPSLHNASLEGMDPVLVPNASDTDLHCQGMFFMGRDSSSKTDTPQTFPFSWE